ncbi:HAD-IA family hydrolase [uncultured Paraglaciecola sp.]|uniref:HAD family hydrolase n=1 Tax=uncultured Paraglaciecola sp. TaxID=1765024 RepID=UPI0025947809|nr:HAD-IA family hydrolase [uncultured Paraglaciecola sp.]
MKYKAIIFDWDGTLMDSVTKIVESMQISAKHFGLPVPSYNEAKNVIGISLLPALKKLFSIDDHEEAIKLMVTYKEHFKNHSQISSPMFEGALDMLEELKSRGHVLAVATGKARLGLEHNLLHSNTGHLFTTSRTADDANSKPSPDMLKQILAELNLQASEVVMVGDTTYDMEMAESIGMDRVAVSFGVHESKTLMRHKPIAIIDSLSELTEIV